MFQLAKLARGAGARPGADREAGAGAGEGPRAAGRFIWPYNGWQIDDIVAKYEFTRSQVVCALRKLDGIGVLRSAAGRSGAHEGGATCVAPARADRAGLWSLWVVGEFLRPEFDQVGGMFRFEFRELSNASFEVLKRKLERLADEVHELPSWTACCRRKNGADGGCCGRAAAVDGVDGEWFAVEMHPTAQEP